MMPTFPGMADWVVGFRSVLYVRIEPQRKSESELSHSTAAAIDFRRLPVTECRGYFKRLHFHVSDWTSINSCVPFGGGD